MNTEYSCVFLRQGLLLACILIGLVSCTLIAGTPVFEDKIDIGKVNLPGSIQFNTDQDMIRMTGSGENIWATQDAFCFIWNKVEGDISCKTSVAWGGKGKNPHRKADWMMRDGLELDAAYIDAVIRLPLNGLL